MNCRSILIATLVFSVVGCATTSVYEEPFEVKVPDDMDASSVAEAVDWGVRTEKRCCRLEEAIDPNRLRVGLVGTSEKVLVEWNASMVTIKHVDDGDHSGFMPFTTSANRYQKRVVLLTRSIRMALQAEQARIVAERRQPRRTMPLGVLVVGDTIASAKKKLATYGTPELEGPVLTPDGVQTGYTLVTYDGHPPNVGSRFVTLVFFNGRYVTHGVQSKPDTELLVFDDFTNKLFEAKKITFSEYVAWKKRKWFEVRDVAPDPFEEELFLYQLWQAERVDAGKSTLAEYRFLLTEKDRQIREAKSVGIAAEERAAATQRLAAYQAEMVSLQRQAVDQQRRANVSNAILNAFSATYRPSLPRTINCTTTSYSGYSSTSCY